MPTLWGQRASSRLFRVIYFAPKDFSSSNLHLKRQSFEHGVSFRGIKILRVISWPFLAIINIILIIVCFPLGFLYGAIYLCPHPSANTGMRRKDMPSVQTYLDHFQRLHPELMSRISNDAKQDTEGWIHRELDMWPHSAEGRFMPTVHNDESCPAAILFAGLEHGGWSRRVIWTLLREQVEEAGLVSDTEKLAFARVMSTMCDHQVTERGWAMIRWAMRHGLPNPEVTITLPELDIEAGNNTIEASTESLNWILKEGKIVRPPLLIKGHKSILVLMLQLSMEFSTVWDIKWPTDSFSTRRRYWQLVEVPDEMLE